MKKFCISGLNIFRKEWKTMDKKELSSRNEQLWSENNSEDRKIDINRLNSTLTTGKLTIPDHWEGYECLLSDDLFTVLALDVSEYEEYEDELVKQHYDEISKFLNNLIRLKDGGISFHDKYPKLNMELAQHKVNEAVARLETFKKRREYFKEVLENKKRSSREKLAMLISTIIADDRVTVEESLHFIDTATSLHFTEAEAAGILLQEILARGFKPCKPYNSENSQINKLLSTEFERISNTSSANSQTVSNSLIQASSLLSVEDLLESGLIEEYLWGGGKTEGRQWLEFYKSIKTDFLIGSISDLKLLVEPKNHTVFKSELIKMVKIEAGSFFMGATLEHGKEARTTEHPAHEVHISSYFIGKHPVTQREYEKVMGKNPSGFSGTLRPVENVSWFESIEFCNKLSEMELLDKAYSIDGEIVICDFSKNGFRLPTEAEWEYAARGGNLSKNCKFSGGDIIEAVAWYDMNSKNQTQDVATKQANELGLYDMSGNVWEWCWDRYGTYSSLGQTDPKGSDSGTNRVLRGGSWGNLPLYCRVTNRGSVEPAYRGNRYGFRLVRSR